MNAIFNYFKGFYYSYSSQLQQDLTQVFPREIILKIFSYLNSAELATCCLVSKKWRQLASQDDLWMKIIHRELAFGKDKLELYFENIGEEPPLPEDIKEILKAPCSIFPQYSTAKTHWLILKPYAITQLKCPLTRKDQYPGETRDLIELIERYNNTPPSRTCWVLMTRGVLRVKDQLYSERLISKKFVLKKCLITTNYQIPDLAEITLRAFCSHREYLFRKPPLYREPPLLRAPPPVDGWKRGCTDNQIYCSPIQPGSGRIQLVRKL